MSIKGVSKSHWPMIFPHSLEAVPQVWFYSMDPKKISDWDDITLEFNNQYSYNVDTQASIRTLEVLFQKDNEGFTEYLTRWRRVYAQVTTRPNKDELITKFINNLKPIYQAHLRYSNITDFRQLAQIGARIEDDLRTGKMSEILGYNPNKDATSNSSFKI